jgi:hypothetical protein
MKKLLLWVAIGFSSSKVFGLPGAVASGFLSLLDKKDRPMKISGTAIGAALAQIRFGAGSGGIGVKPVIERKEQVEQLKLVIAIDQDRVFTATPLTPNLKEMTFPDTELPTVFQNNEAMTIADRLTGESFFGADSAKKDFTKLFNLFHAFKDINVIFVTNESNTTASFLEIIKELKRIAGFNPAEKIVNSNEKFNEFISSVLPTLASNARAIPDTQLIPNLLIEQQV